MNSSSGWYPTYTTTNLALAAQVNQTQWVNASASSNNIVLYRPATIAQPAQPEPKKESVLEWLDRRINEVIERCYEPVLAY